MCMVNPAEIRQIFGNEESSIFAQRLNLQCGTLSNYEIRAHESTCSIINTYYTAL